MVEAATSQSALNTRFHEEVGTADWQTVLAREVFYHRTCYRDATRTLYVKQGDENDEIFQELSTFVEEQVISECQVVLMTDLLQKYTEIQTSKFGRIHGTFKIQSLKEKLTRRFGSQIGFWRPTKGSVLYSTIQSRKDSW